MGWNNLKIGLGNSVCTLTVLLVEQVEKLKSTNKELEQELNEERLAHDRSRASMEMAQLTATELEKVGMLCICQEASEC